MTFVMQTKVKFKIQKKKNSWEHKLDYNGIISVWEIRNRNFEKFKWEEIVDRRLWAI